MTLSTHVLDTAAGQGAAGIAVSVLHRHDSDGWSEIGAGVTGADGRAVDLVPAALWQPGRWRLVFDTASHLGADAFLPEVTVEFRTRDRSHHHVPLLLAPFGYTVYRGT